MRLRRLNAAMNSAGIVGAHHAAAAREAQRLDDAGIGHLLRDLGGVAGQREAAEDGQGTPAAAISSPHDAFVARGLGGLRRIVWQIQARRCLRGEQRRAVVHRHHRVNRMLGVEGDDARDGVGHVAEVQRQAHVPLLGQLARQVESLARPRHRAAQPPPETPRAR